MRHRWLAWALFTAGCGGTSSMEGDAGRGGSDATVPGNGVDASPEAGVDSSAVADAGLGPDSSDSSAPPDATAPSACVPGQSVACVGPGGCATNQVCNDTGTAFGPCVCASNDGGERACVPGASVGCVGPGGCVSRQVCASDGSGYGACDCASDGGSTLACVPGQSIACAGPDGCVSFQICRADGSGYAPCACPDAGVTSDASVAWTPAKLAGLVLWFDPDDGFVQDPAHAGFVQHWLDKSGHGNIGNTSNKYAGPGIFTGDSIDAKAVNGHDALICSGPTNITDYLFSVDASPTLDWGSGDFAILAVTSIAPGDVWNGGGVRVTLTGATASLTVAQQSVTMPISPGGVFGIVAARGQALRLQVGGQTTVGGTNTSSLTPGTLAICSPGQRLAELIAVKGPVSDADLARVTEYLRAKFAL